jgi:UDP-N-acetyl-D-galactosamine dehydrogenase
MIYDKLIKKEATLAVVGLGYVGLPIALEFARKTKVLGFDINAERVEMMKNNEDPSQELDSSAFDGCDIEFSADPEDLKRANFFVIAVPTPIDENNLPDLRPVLSASRTVGNALKKGDYVVYESTVYPGCTEEDCVPVLEELSGLKMTDDFMVGYSPERINPHTDTIHSLQKFDAAMRKTTMKNTI